MKKLLFLIMFSCVTTLFGQTKTFKGAWFEIKYPSTFTAKPSLKSTTSDNGYESAFFQSPDGLAEFYIFSPQWSGIPTDIVLKNNEKIFTSKNQNLNGKVIKWWTIVSKAGNYTRTYQETTDKISNTNWVVGLKYKNQAAYNMYKNQYLFFKSSLQQFAD